MDCDKLTPEWMSSMPHNKVEMKESSSVMLDSNGQIRACSHFNKSTSSAIPLASCCEVCTCVLINPDHMKPTTARLIHVSIPQIRPTSE